MSPHSAEVQSFFYNKIMKKETFYFSHDYTSRADEKIKNLMYEFGPEGYGVYWILIEELYQNANVMQTHYKRIAFDLRIDEEKIRSIIEDFGLFTIDDNVFSSASVQRRLDLRDQKSDKAREAAQRRWDKKVPKATNNAYALQEHSNKDADVIQEECNSNAIKETKVKESKLNSSNEEEYEENWKFVEENWTTTEKFTHSLKADWFKIPLSEQKNIVDLIAKNPGFFKLTKFWKRNFLQQAQGSYDWLYNKVETEAVKLASQMELDELYKDIK